jgi:hypothetical protein
MGRASGQIGIADLGQGRLNVSESALRHPAITASGRLREAASGIGAELGVTAAQGIAVARGSMSTAGYGPDAAFR